MKDDIMWSKATAIYMAMDDYSPSSDDYEDEEPETKSHVHTFNSGPYGCTICGLNPVNNRFCQYPVVDVSGNPNKENLLVKLKSEDVPDTLLEKKLVEAIKEKAKELEQLLEEEPKKIAPEDVVEDDDAGPSTASDS